MLQKSAKILTIVLIVTLLFPSGAFAYSYGDPSKEDIAETFKLLLVRLNNDSPDWPGALEAYKVRRAEISSHFGESIAVTLDINFEDKNKDLLINNYKALLAKNIKRRFDYAEKDINDYSKTKILLAKAKGTYDTIQPYVQELAPNETNNLETAFEKALEALGNPGLFGVGEKPVQPEEFKKQAFYILETITPLFPYTEAKKSDDSQSTPTTDEKKSDDSQSTPTTDEKKSITTSTADTDKSSSPTEQSSSSAQESDSTGSSTNESKEKDSEEAQTEPKSEETSTNDSGQETKIDSEQNNKQSSEEIELSESNTDIAEVEVAKEDSVKAHDPMERTKKTNTATSIIVITLVASLGIGSILFLRKKGFI